MGNLRDWVQGKMMDTHLTSTQVGAEQLLVDSECDNNYSEGTCGLPLVRWLRPEGSEKGTLLQMQKDGRGLR